MTGAAIAARYLVAAAAVAAALPLQANDALRAREGEQVYRRHCAQCHGENADGQGIHAKRFNPPPSNLAASKRSDEYRLQIITLGGQAMGRSQVMPQWGLEISGQDIRNVVVYLRRLSDESARRAKAGGSSSAQKAGAHG